jgi:signal transduction histidine kinase
MGGSIRVESRENDGSRFIVTLLKGVQMPAKAEPKNRTLTHQ